MAATALPRDGVALQTVVRVPLFAIFSQPPLPRFLQFPHSSRHLLLPFGTRQGKVRSFGPLSALSSPPSTVPSLPTGLLYRNHTFRLPAVRVTLLPPSSSSFRQLQLFQWIDHNVFVTSYSPATRTSFASFTPSVNAPGDQRGRGTRCFHLPPWGPLRCVLSTRLPAFPRCSPGSFPEA